MAIFRNSRSSSESQSLECRRHGVKQCILLDAHRLGRIWSTGETESCVSVIFASEQTRNASFMELIEDCHRHATRSRLPLLCGPWHFQRECNYLYLRGNSLSQHIILPSCGLGFTQVVRLFLVDRRFCLTNCEEVQTTIARLNTEADEDEDRIRLVPINKPSIEPQQTARQPSAGLDSQEAESYCSSSTWQSWLLRAFFLLQLLGLIFLGTKNLVSAFSENSVVTITLLCLALFYITILITTILALGYYFTRNLNKSIVLPCMFSLWYQIYTGLVFCSIIVLVIIASLENWLSPCGVYTTYPSDISLCGNTFSSAKNTTDGVFGVAITGNTTTDLAFDLVQSQGGMSVLFFEGSCQGWFYRNDDSTGFEGFQFVNNSSLDSGLPFATWT